MLYPQKVYTFYITTNTTKTVLYCGVTSDLYQRVVEHYLNRGQEATFAGRYSCYWLLYYEDFKYVEDAIAREKEVKKWRREKKERLIKQTNPQWKFLNGLLFKWPPVNAVHRRDMEW
jgi:putative endonuclease